MEEVLASVRGRLMVTSIVFGLSLSDREKMKNGKIEDPEEGGWTLRNGTTYHKRSSSFHYGDEEEWMNGRAFRWECGPNADFWMKLPTAPTTNTQ